MSPYACYRGAATCSGSNLHPQADGVQAESKLDLSPREMMALWREGSPESKARIGAYCVQDTALPLRLAKRLEALTSLFGTPVADDVC